MNTLKPTTKPDVGLDRATRWIIVTSLAVVFIGVGMGAVCLFSGPDSTSWFLEYGWWVPTGGALLGALGYWRATRRWSSSGRHTDPGKTE